jgi:hypothetical protein
VYNFDIEKIHETAWVFKNAIKNSQDFVDYFESNQEWKDWYTFGKMSEGPDWPPTTFEKFPTVEEWEDSKPYSDTSVGSKNYFANQIDDLFYYATKAYVEANNVSLDNWSVDGWNVAKYVPNPEEHEDYVMMHHTDFQREFEYNPGLKFGITAVCYLNDSYDGGEVLFRFLDENDPSIIKEDYTYKPAAGDIVVFPSGPPHYHGVKAVSNGEKYIIRTYWRYDYPGHPLWLKLQEKYGEDIWRQLEDQRLKFNRNSDNVEVINNIPFWLGFEDYYKKEIESLGL